MRCNHAPPSSFSTDDMDGRDASTCGRKVNGERSFTRRRLTRQRKLRHVTDEEVGLQRTARSKSLPGSPESNRGRCGSEHWSNSAVPMPLPLPVRSFLRGPISTGTIPSSPAQFGTPDEAPGLVFGRKKTDNAVKSLGNSWLPVHGVSTQRVKLERANGNYASNASGPRRSNATDAFRLQYTLNPTKSLSNSCGGLLRDLRLNIVDQSYGIRFDASARSAPTSEFVSPAVSPGRQSGQEFFKSSFLPPCQEHRGLLALDIANFRPNEGSSLSKEKNVDGSYSYTLHSPKTRRPELGSKGLEYTVANAYPLPLPPLALSQPQPPDPSPVTHVAENITSVSVRGGWRKGKLIGCGTFGRVYVGIHRDTGAWCAMKEVDIIADDPKSAECIKQLEQEIKVLRHMKHKNIVQYYGSEIVDDHFYIYLEYIHPGSLNKYIREHHGDLSETIIRNFTRHILSGLAYLHSKKTIHRDIKCANLLVDTAGTVKLADFGMAKHLTGMSYELSLKGSPHWMAPEVVKAVLKKNTNPDLAMAVDIWSLGCAIIEMWNGRPPWGELEWCQAMFKVLNRTPPIPDSLSAEGKDFLRSCFRRNPADRPSALTLLEHPFVRTTGDQNESSSMPAPSRTEVQEKPGSPRSGSCKTNVMPSSYGGWLGTENLSSPGLSDGLFVQ